MGDNSPAGFEINAERIADNQPYGWDLKYLPERYILDFVSSKKTSIWPCFGQLIDELNIHPGKEEN
jgi:hypothetical protein